MKCIDAAITAKIDEYASQKQKLSHRVLMGNAGRFIADTVAKDAKIGARFLFFCGSGNNGGDGYAAAVTLAERGYKAYAIDVTEGGQRSDAGRYYLSLYKKKVGIPLSYLDITEETLAEYAEDSHAVIEAVYGAGFSPEKPLSEAVTTTLCLLNRLHYPKKYAVDVPLGVCGSSGTAIEGAFLADVTLALSFPKRGVYLYPGCLYAGKVLSSAIGIDLIRAAREFTLNDDALDDASVRRLLPKRRPDMNKGDGGNAVLLAGSPLYPGAASLASAAALRTGAGYVHLVSDASVTQTAVARTPSLLVTAIESDKELLPIARNASALLVGCGTGRRPSLLSLIAHLLSTEGCPLILDADALNLLSEDTDAAQKMLKAARRPVLVTPHPKEFSRLTGIPLDTVMRDRYAAAQNFVRDYGVHLLLKGTATLIAATDGRVFINTTGNDALAKAGSGDVLAGVILSFAAQGAPLPEAAAAAAYLHGKAGERLSERYSTYGVLPSDLPAAIAEAITGILQ